MFSEANLERAPLDRSILKDANSSSAKLALAGLREVDADSAMFNDADLLDAILLAANLREAQLENANLSDTDLRGADCSRARFQRREFVRCRLTKAGRPVIERATSCERDGWEAGIRTPITWSRERCTDFGPLLFVRFYYGLRLTCFAALRSVSLRFRAICLIESHPYDLLLAPRSHESTTSSLRDSRRQLRNQLAAVIEPFHR